MPRRPLVAAALAAVAWSCAGERARPPAREARSGGVAVSWTPVPDPIPLNALFGLDLDVTPSGETTIVSVDAGMPGHGHGMTVRPKTVRRPDGRWEARGLLFHMPGEWEITVTVRDGATTETLRCPVTVP